MHRRHRDTGDRVRRAVGEPLNPRPAGPAVDLDQHRRLDVIGLPHLIAPAPRPGQKHIMLARRPLATGEPGPLPRRQITTDRPVQSRNRRRRIPLAPVRTSSQLTMHRRDVPPPQPQQSPDLISNREPPGIRSPLPRRPGRSLVPLGGSQPPPHRTLPHPQHVRRRPHPRGGELPLPPQGQQTAHHRPPQRPNRHSRQSPTRTTTRPFQVRVLLCLIHTPEHTNTHRPADQNSRN